MLNGKNHQVITSVSKQRLLRDFTEGPTNELSEKDQFHLQLALVVAAIVKYFLFHIAKQSS